MPILLQSDTSAHLLNSASFTSEAELESILITQPGLLVDDGELPVAVVKNQIDLLDVGTLDILLTDSEGLPIVVEVKLARNGESRRDVVAQAIDYVSGLTLLTVDDINAKVEGKLDQALRSFSIDDSPESQLAFENRRRDFEGNLRSGTVRIVIVLDEARDDLKRITSFLSGRSHLDIRLLTIGKYSDSNGTMVYVPRIIVSSNEAPSPLARPNLPREALPELQHVLDEYAKIANVGFEAQGKENNYRQVKPQGWPGDIHYEFLTSKEGVRAEIHLEDDKVKSLAMLLQSFATALSGSFSPGMLKWDSKWPWRRGRVFIKYDTTVSPEIVAQSMKRLIELTVAPLTEAIQKLNQTESSTERKNFSP
jgi:hypothetical protein